MKTIDIIVWTIFLILLIYLVYNNICSDHKDLDLDFYSTSHNSTICECANMPKHNKKKNMIIEKYNNIPKLKEKSKKSEKLEKFEEINEEEQYYKTIMQNPIEKEGEIKFIGYNKDYSNLYGNIKSVGEISLEATTDFPVGNEEFME